MCGWFYIPSQFLCGQRSDSRELFTNPLGPGTASTGEVTPGHSESRDPEEFWHWEILVYLPRLWEILHKVFPPQRPHEETHWGEGLCVQWAWMPVEILPLWRPPKTQKKAWGTASSLLCQVWQEFFQIELSQAAPEGVSWSLIKPWNLTAHKEYLTSSNRVVSYSKHCQQELFANVVFRWNIK